MQSSIPKIFQLPLQEEMSNEYTHSNQQGSQHYITKIKNNKSNKYGKHTTRFSTWQNEGFFVCSTSTQVYRLHPPPLCKTAFCFWSPPFLRHALLAWRLCCLQIWCSFEKSCLLCSCSCCCSPYEICACRNLHILYGQIIIAFIHQPETTSYLKNPSY